MLNMADVCFKDYRESCLKFNKESNEWYALDPYKFYTSTSGGDWEETCDNGSEGGVDVSWVFGISKEEVENKCQEEFFQLIKEDINTICGSLEEWDIQELIQYLEWANKALKSINF